MEDKKYYTAYEISKRYNIFKDTVYKRFQSKYAKDRWGVVKKPTVELVVPASELYRWEKIKNYRKITNAELEEIKKAHENKIN